MVILIVAWESHPPALRCLSGFWISTAPAAASPGCSVGAVRVRVREFTAIFCVPLIAFTENEKSSRGWRGSTGLSTFFITLAKGGEISGRISRDNPWNFHPENISHQFHSVVFHMESLGAREVGGQAGLSLK